MFYDADGKYIPADKSNRILFWLIHNIDKLKNPDIVRQDFNLENSITKIDGENKKMFLKFVDRMLQWDPEERSTAGELLDDPWLKGESELK